MIDPVSGAPIEYEKVQLPEFGEDVHIRKHTDEPQVTQATRSLRTLS